MIANHWTSLMAIIGLLWPALHFAVYYFLLRTLLPLKTERGIFLFHLFSFFALSVVLASCFLSEHISRNAFTVIIFSLCIHGIYSLTFLELWSLSQGSFSLQLLEAIAANKELPMISTLRAGGDIGADKLRQRMESLRTLGLLSPDGLLTIPGRIAAFLLYGILIVSAGRSLNT